jgi:hypothetical protein
VWTGPLKARWTGTARSPITIGAFGSGDLPRIQNAHENVAITGSYLVIEDIWTRSDVPARDSGCENQPLGYRIGFRFMPGSAHDTVRGSRADEQYIGILVEAGAHHHRILDNTLRDNNMRDPNRASGAGSVGIGLMGDDNEVGYNDISGSDACSPLYGRDGAAVEVYGGRGNLIHHNRAAENHNFTELGKPPSADNTYAFNRVTSSLDRANFLVTRGPGDMYGPVYRTRLYNNTVYLSGAHSYAIQCYGGCAPGILTFRNNIVWAEDRIGYADNAFDEGNNIYWRSDGAPRVYFPIAPSSKEIDPRFMDPESSELHLRQTSPGVDAATPEALALGLTRDLDGVLVPQAGGPDIGAYERRGGADQTPPVAGIPVARIVSPATLSSAGVRLRLSWTGDDLGSGVASYTLQHRTDGGAWQTAGTVLPASTQRTFVQPNQSTLGSRVLAVDRAGNRSAWTVMPSVRLSTYDDATSLATYSGGWRTGSAASFWRGRAHLSTTAGAAASFRFTGQAVALVATVSNNRGRAKIYVDDRYVKTVELRGTTTRYRQVVFATRVAQGAHTLKVVVLRTTARTRVDIDGFIVLR